jgi:hypothetical protein
VGHSHTTLGAEGAVSGARADRRRVRLRGEGRRTWLTAGCAARRSHFAQGIYVLASQAIVSKIW